MATASEIKGRIAGVRDTKKITDAMYMISSVKMRRAARDFEQTSPYFEALSEKIGELFTHIPKTESRYFHMPDPEDKETRKHGLLLITADKGLAGAYNQEVIRLCESYLSQNPDTTLFVVGEFGRQYFLSHKIPFVQDFHYSLVEPRMEDARRICAELLERYNAGELDEINIIYTDYAGSKPGQCRGTTLLPLDRADFIAPAKSGSHSEKKFLPDADTVLEGVIPSYLMGFVHGCLVKSFCSEQQARMMAMKSAGDNAEEMLKALQLQYNKIRQASITNEMIEITAGVRALKRQHEPAAGDMCYDQ